MGMINKLFVEQFTTFVEVFKL